LQVSIKPKDKKMKTKILTFIAFIFILISGCKKGITDANPKSELTAIEFNKQEVIDYVLSKRIKGDNELNSSIDTILNMANWGQYKIVEKESGERLTAVTINSFSNKKLILLLYSNKQKKGYRNVELASIKKAINSKTNELDALVSIFKNQVTLFSGEISYFKITKEFMYEVGYEEGMQKFARSLTEDRSSNSGSQLIEQCYSVYLVTYYSNGTTTQEYMYSFCENAAGDCHQMRLLDISTVSAANGMRCGPWSGGGGAGNQEYAIELPTTQLDWEVAKAASGMWVVKSTEQFKGVEASQGGKQFTETTHLGDNAFSLTQHYNVLWSRQGATNSLLNIWQARCQISGKLSIVDSGSGNSDPNELVIDKWISNQKVFTPNEVW
jgi:hypothetical protein